jgi:uncharacterized protein
MRAIQLNNPFIHRFKTDNNYYIYDVNTNRIHCVDQITYQILDDYSTLTQEQIINKYKDQADPTEVANTLKILETTIHKDKIFSNHRPAALKFAESPSSIKHNLSTQLSQLVLNITEQCNMRCKYCIYSGKYPYERVHQNQHMTLKTAKKAIDFYLSNSRQSKKHIIGFYGGEPLLKFELIKNVVEYVKEKKKVSDIIFSVSTNGILLNKSLIDFFYENNFFLSISLDGPKEIHDRYRVFKNGRGSFDTVIRKLKMIKNRDEEYYKKSVTFLLTLSSSELLELEHFFSSCNLTVGQNLVISDIREEDTTFFNVARKNNSNLKKNKSNCLSRFKMGLINGKAGGMGFLSILYGSLFTPLIKRPLTMLCDEYYPPEICIPGLSRLFVSIKGKFFICDMFGEHFCIGDVNNGFDFDAIFKLLETWRSLNETECLNCWALRLCKLCWVHARKGDKLVLERMRKSCKNMRESLDIYLSFYASVMEKNPNAFDFLKTFPNHQLKV